MIKTQDRLGIQGLIFSPKVSAVCRSGEVWERCNPGKPAGRAARGGLLVTGSQESGDAGIFLN